MDCELVELEFGLSDVFLDCFGEFFLPSGSGFVVWSEFCVYDGWWVGVASIDFVDGLG